MKKQRLNSLNKDEFPVVEGVYLIQGYSGASDNSWREEDVYKHPTKGLCIWNPDGGADDLACHTSVQFSGLVFGKRIRNV